MKKKLPITLIIFVLLLHACTKNSSKDDVVLIRVENTTAENFSNCTLNATEFGAFFSGDTSNYFRCTNVYPIPFANYITINNKAIFIFDISPTPFLKDGNYLMKVVSDTLPYRYQATFIKE